MMNFILLAASIFMAAPAVALDAACTSTTNLSIPRCPENSEDWYDSYTGVVDGLDALSKTAPSSFTVAGAAGLKVNYGIQAASSSLSGGLTASSGTFLATGTSQYSIHASSGILIDAGGITWPDGSKSTTAATASSGGGGHTLSTGTISGSAVSTSSFKFTQRSTMTFDTAGFELIDDPNANATIVKAKGMQIIASTGTRWCSAVGTAVTANRLELGISGSTITLTTGNNDVMVCGAGTISNSNSGSLSRLGVLRDGQYLSGFSSSLAIQSRPDSSNFSFCLRDRGVSAGQHSYTMTAGADGSITVYVPQNVAGNCAEFSATEVATGGQGYSIPASSQTVGVQGTFTATVNGTAISGSTVTLTTRGGDVIATFSGYIKNTAGVRTAVGLIVDSSYTNICKQTSNLFLTNTYDTTATAPVQQSFSCRITGLSAGSHTFALTGGVTSGTGSIGNDGASPDASTVFRVDEVIGAAGGGDVSSNGPLDETGEWKMLSLPKASAPTANVTYREGLAKAWVVFTGTGTVTIQDSYNISSITDNGTGDHTLNFLTPFATNRYVCSCMTTGAASTSGAACQIHSTEPTASAYRFYTNQYTDGVQDRNIVMVTCFGRQ